MWIVVFGWGCPGRAWRCAVSKGKLDFKPLATDLLSRGMDAKDALLSKVESIKEDVEDLTAEARLAAEKRKNATDSAEA